MIFAGELKDLTENLNNLTEKLKKFQKYSMSGKFIYSGCLYYGEKKEAWIMDTMGHVWTQG